MSARQGCRTGSRGDAAGATGPPGQGSRGPQVGQARRPSPLFRTSWQLIQAEASEIISQRHQIFSELKYSLIATAASRGWTRQSSCLPEATGQPTAPLPAALQAPGGQALHPPVTSPPFLGPTAHGTHRGVLARLPNSSRVAQYLTVTGEAP